jgi:hypothetical protein
VTNQELFVDLIHRLADYEEAMVLQLLLALRADMAPLRSGKRKLQEQLGAAISEANVQRAIGRLALQGLITTRVYPNTYTEFRINVEALDALLCESIPATKCFPGVSSEPIHYLINKADRMAQQDSNAGLNAMTTAASGQETDVPPDVASHKAPATTGGNAGDPDQPSQPNSNVEKQP